MRHHHPAEHARPIRLRTAATASAAAVLAIAAAAVTMAAMTRPAISAPRPMFHTDAAMSRRAVLAQRVAARDAATRHAHAAYVAGHATIRRGDTLSRIAAAHGMSWMALYEANRGRVGHNPNTIVPGMVLRIPGHPRVWEARYAAHPYVAPRPHVIPVGTPTHPSGGSGGSVDPVAAQAPSGGNTAPVSGGSFEDCVIARESGGNSQVMNSSGHYGLFQFDIGTWISGGGSAADFGHASTGEQQAVFNSVYAARGTSPWAPYDGC